MATIQESWKVSAWQTIRDVDISSSGGYTAAGSYDNHVYFYDKKGNLLWKYKAGDSVRDVAVSFNGRFVAAGSYDHHVYFFNREGTLLWKYRTGGEIRDLVISGEGNFVAAVSNDHFVYFFNKEGTLLWKHDTGDKVLCLALSLRADFIVVGTFDNTVHFLNKDGRLLWKFSALSTVLDVEMSSKGRYIAVGSRDRFLYYLSNEGELLWKHRCLFPVEKVAISPNGEFVAIGIEGSVLYFSREGVLLWEKGIGEFEVTGLEFSVFGESVIVGTQGAQLLFYDKKGRNLWKYTTPSPVEKANISANGRYIVAGLTNGELLFFDGLDFFRWVFNNARESVQFLHNYGIKVKEIDSHITASKTFFDEKKYLDSLRHALRAKILAKEAIRTHTPELRVEVILEKKLMYHEWSPVVFEIENTGQALAFDVRLDIEGDFQVGGNREVCRECFLAVYEKKVMELRIRPLKTKNLAMHINVSYINFGGRRFTQTSRTNIYIHPPEHLKKIGYESVTDAEKQLLKKDSSLVRHKGEGVVRQRQVKRKRPGTTTQASKERLVLRCPNCNREIKQEWMACPFCATLLK